MYRKWNQFGILNHEDEPWTPRTFDTEHAATEYLNTKRIAWPNKGGLDQHSVVPVTVTVTVIVPIAADA